MKSEVLRSFVLAPAGAPRRFLRPGEIVTVPDALFPGLSRGGYVKAHVPAAVLDTSAELAIPPAPAPKGKTKR